MSIAALTVLRAAAAARALSAREAIENRIIPLTVRARDAWADPPRVSLWVPLLILCASILVLPVSTWLKGRAVDREWRAKIAASSAAVRAIVAREGEDALQSDAVIIKALGETDVQLAKAEADLRAVRPTADGCPLIPRRCLASGSVR